MLAAGRPGSDPAWAAALVQDAHGGAGHAGQAHGSPDGPRGRIDPGGVLARDSGHAATAHGRADGAVGGGVGGPPRDGARLAGIRARSPAAEGYLTCPRKIVSRSSPKRSGRTGKA